MKHPVTSLLEEQIAYYRARAGEYDEWFLRRGRYDHGAAANRQWFAEVEEVAGELARFGPSGSILEIACGTGFWTGRLVADAATLTAVDVSAEVIALNRRRLRDDRVRYVEADIFAWRPESRYDLVFFSFWLSHVPPVLFARFWEIVAACLAPEGRVFFIDSRYNPASTAVGQPLDGRDGTTLVRTLNDGRQFRIVKLYYEPDELAHRLRALGWAAEVRTTREHLLYGWASRR